MSASVLPTTCLIGAGSSGIAVVKALEEHRIPFDCFEKSDRIGGNYELDKERKAGADRGRAFALPVAPTVADRALHR